MTLRIAVLTTPAYHHYIYLQNIISQLGDSVDIFFYSSTKKGSFDLLNFLSVCHEFSVYQNLKSGLDFRSVPCFDYINKLLEFDWSSFDYIVIYGLPKIPSCIINHLGPSKVLNHHGGVLPFVRGLDSDYWSILNNRSSDIGCSLHILTERLDAGDILLVSRLTYLPLFIWHIRALKALLHSQLLLQFVNAPSSGSSNNLSDGNYYTKMNPFLKLYVSILYFFRT